MSITVGSRLGPYEVLGAIGAGGMGEVYRARDTRLHRDVALKVLPSSVSADPDRLRRFEREARTVAALNHPHICQIHDVGPGYLVLEYIEGSPLRGPLPPDEAVRVALQITSALEAAHRRGIFHRDLKPDNIRLTPDGNAKLLDFGLAALSHVNEDVTRTISGTVLGTAPYMSPEQAEGKPVDERSDIFSFGAVLYEMLSGTRAFGGDSCAQVLSAVLRDDPPPLKVPGALAALVSRCLAKSPPQRFQTMGDVTNELQRVSRNKHEAEASIAVLPFANMSRDPDDEYFSDGPAEEIINALTHVPGLKVTARTSAFAFRGKDLDIRSIGEALRVRTILEGSVRRAGQRIRVTAQLINAEDGYHLWSERYDRELTDVFVVQDEISSAITDALRLTLSAKPRDVRRHTPVLAAHDAHLKGLQLVGRNTADSMTRSQPLFERAIALDPDYAEPHVALGNSYVRMAVEGVRRATEVMPHARTQALAALALNSQDLDAQALLGVVAAAYDYDWKKVERLWQVLRDRPDLPNAVQMGSYYLTSRRRYAEVVDWLQRALQHDPLNWLGRVILGMRLMWQQRYDLALAELDKAAAIDGGAPSADFVRCETAVRQGKLDEALILAERAYNGASWHPRFVGLFAGALRRTSHDVRADEVIARLRNTPDAIGVPMGMVVYHLMTEEIDAAVEWLEKAVEQREPLAVVNVGHPLRARAHSSARWLTLMRTMKIEAYA